LPYKVDSVRVSCHLGRWVLAQQIINAQQAEIRMDGASSGSDGGHRGRELRAASVDITVDQGNPPMMRILWALA
jgi:hypothetical protein